MKTIKLLIISISVLIITCSSPEVFAQKTEYVTVEINYGDKKESKKKKVEWKEGMTALEALQYSSVVTTHPVEIFVFVSSIDGVEGKRGVAAWYYKVNGESAEELAINTKLKAGDVTTWIYKKDVCSGTVDK